MILILDNSPEEIAKSLDDKSLEKMIKSIAQTLCNVHLYRLENGINHVKINQHRIKDAENIIKKVDKKINKVPLKAKNINDEWSQWARECVANYKWLISFGLSCLNEFKARFYISPENIMETKFPKHEMKSVIEWARDNVPELPDHPYGSHLNDEITDFPLVMPEKFKIVLDTSTVIQHCDFVESYRNYYNHLLSRKYYCKACKSKEYLEDEYKCICYGQLEQLWTRREKPEWVKLDD